MEIALISVVALVGATFLILAICNFLEGSDGTDWYAGTQIHGSSNSFASYGAGGAGSGTIAAAIAQQNAIIASSRSQYVALQNAGTQRYLGAAPQQMCHQVFQSPAFLGGGVPTIHAVGWIGPHGPTELKSEGIRAGEIIGWRGWFVVGGELRSMTADAAWQPGVPMTGDPANGFGIHAYKSPHGPSLDGYCSRAMLTPWVIGEVALWGDVIEHTEGYRAEFGRPHSFVTWSDNIPREIRDEITKKYLPAPE